MLRFFLACALSASVALAQESTSLPSSMPAAQCEGCLSPQVFSLTPALSLDVTKQTNEGGDARVAQRLTLASKRLGWVSVASFLPLGVLSVLDGGDAQFLLNGGDAQFIALFSGGATAAVGINTAAALRAGARYRESGDPTQLRRAALYFSAASVLQMGTFIMASEAVDISSGGGLLFSASLVSGSFASLAISTGFALRGVQERRALVLSQREPTTTERSFQEDTLFKQETSQASAFLAKTALGLTAASAAMFPSQSEFRDRNAPYARLYSATSIAALTASTSALYLHGLYRYSKVKKPAPLYATAGILATQSALRAGLSAASFFIAEATDEEFGPSGNYLNFASFGVGAAISGVSALVLLGKARVERTRYLAQQRREATLQKEGSF